MGTKISACIILFISMLSFTFVRTGNEIKTMDVEEAIQKRIITANFVSTGKYQGNSIIASFKSNLETAIKIKIPAGTYFNAQTKEEQDLVSTKDMFVQIEPKKMASQIVDGFCCIASNRCPVKGNHFSIASNKIENFNKLTAFLKEKTYSNHILQDAVWTLSDQKPISNITSDKPQEVKSLREELSKITGLKNEWYDSPQNRQLDRNGNINPQTVSIQGIVEFDNKSQANVHQEIQDEQGNVKFKGDKIMKLEKGKVEYNFKVQVKGWQKGKYYFKLMNENAVLFSNEFQV